jgi:hypothetical protein
MSPRAALGRLSHMDGAELRFRATCEARNLLGRARQSLRPPRNDRRRLARLLDPSAGPLVAEAIGAIRRGDVLAAHRALARHLATRTSGWPLQAARRAALVDAIRSDHPDATREARRRADRILEGRHDLLGYRDLRVGTPPDWHVDATNGRRPPLVHWTRVPYLDPAFGDHKVIWEINRHQYWMTLGSAYWLTGDRRYRDTVIAHLESWIAANPPLRGVNWASMLELAFRAMSWTWAVEFFAADGANDDTPWLVDLLVSLDAQLSHVSQNLSRYFSPNTHLTGEALALYAVSAAFPELRRSAARVEEGRTVLLAEARCQVLADGGHAELSAHYHRYTTDFYLLALMVARAAGDGAASTFEDTVRRLAAYLRTMADDRGVLPLVGDDDGGQLFRFNGRPPADASSTLAAAACVLGDSTLAVGPAGDEVGWILGRRAECGLTRAPWRSRLLADSGYFVSRDGSGNHLVFDAGRHGFLNGGHAHADALSVVLRVHGEPLLVDPGTATYVADPALRDRMRSARMHNTVVLDGREHAVPRGAFHWASTTDARMLVARTGSESDFAVGAHDGYPRRRHLRAVLAMHGVGWLFVDRIVGEGHVTADAWWHLHPSWHAALRDGVIALRSESGRRLAFATSARDVAIVNDPAFTTFAPEYGRIEHGMTIRTGHTATAPFTIGTFVPATAAMSDALAMVELPAQRTPDWVTCRFAICTRQGELRVSVSFPVSEARPQGDHWPQPCIEQLVQSCVE